MIIGNLLDMENEPYLDTKAKTANQVTEGFSLSVDVLSSSSSTVHSISSPSHKIIQSVIRANNNNKKDSEEYLRITLADKTSSLDKDFNLYIQLKEPHKARVCLEMLPEPELVKLGEGEREEDKQVGDRLEGRQLSLLKEEAHGMVAMLSFLPDFGEFDQQKVQAEVILVLDR